MFCITMMFDFLSLSHTIFMHLSCGMFVYKLVNNISVGSFKFDRILISSGESVKYVSWAWTIGNKK